MGISPLLLLACINAVHALSAYASMASDSVAAFFSFLQTVDGVSVSVAGLGFAPRTDYAFQVHASPVTAGCGSTGGHFDVLGIAADACVPGNVDTCQAGDLSGKWGPLFANATGGVQKDFLDRGLSLVGANSIVGRSVVIQRGQDAGLCGNITLLSPQ